MSRGSAFIQCLHHSFVGFLHSLIHEFSDSLILGMVEYVIGFFLFVGVSFCTRFLDK